MAIECPERKGAIQSENQINHQTADLKVWEN